MAEVDVKLLTGHRTCHDEGPFDREHAMTRGTGSEWHCLQKFSRNCCHLGPPFLAHEPSDSTRQVGSGSTQSVQLSSRKQCGEYYTQMVVVDKT